MIVEFVGLPGVGKSYLCRALVDVYSDIEGARVRIVVEEDASALGALRLLLEKLWRAARFAATHVETTRKMVLTVGPGGRLVRRGRFSKFVNLLAETDRSACGSPSAICISEQGVLQAVWSLEMRCEHSVQAELLETLVPWLPDRVVFVLADRLEHESRLRRRERGRSYFDRLETDSLQDAVERGSRCAHDILDIWARHVPRAERLDFRNDGVTRVGDIVDWVDSGRRGAAGG